MNNQLKAVRHKEVKLTPILFTIYFCDNLCPTDDNASKYTG